MLSLLNGEGVLVSNEIIPTRNSILRENIAKWGAANSIVTQTDVSVFGKLREVFDVIVVDAPCSGEGLFRRDPEAISEWSESNVEMCVMRQEDILQKIIPALKPGGFLIYATCTFESSECEVQVKRLLENGFEVVDQDDPGYGINKSAYGLSFYPHKVRGEGFFISLLRKTGDSRKDNYKSKRKFRSEKISGLEYFTSADFTPVSNDGKVYLYNQQVRDFMEKYSESLFIRTSGVFAGEPARGELIPSAELALNINLSKDVNAVDVNEEQALSYLRGETGISVDAPNGWVLIRSRGMGLGWVKKMQGRINNYYPKEWRVRLR
jgi:NOL1/NOP2/fmu family ribosome biogenesis protein